MEEKKIFVVDTNVFLHDPKALFAFIDHQVVILDNVIEEIDRNKTGFSGVANNARYFSREIDKLTEKYPDKIIKGMPIEFHRGTIAIKSIGRKDVRKLNLEDTVDNRIIALAKKLQIGNSDCEIVIVSKDNNLKIQARIFELKAEDYETDMIVSDDIYSGKDILIVDSISKFIECNGRDYIKQAKFFPNQCVMVKEGHADGSSLLVIFKGDHFKIVGDNNCFYRKIGPKNNEQHFVRALLFDPTIKLVTLVGRAGTGKTLLAIAAALDQLDRVYTSIKISRPVIAVKNQEIGFLPGDIEEKMNPWMSPIFDALDLIYLNGKVEGGLLEKDKSIGGGRKQWEELRISGKIQIEALAYIRGRSIPNSFIIIDEAQNLSPLDVKTIITRVGQNTKIILTGDPDQIDHPYLTANSNGLIYVVEKFKKESIAGHIVLTKGERSELAELAANIL